MKYTIIYEIKITTKKIIEGDEEKSGLENALEVMSFLLSSYEEEIFSVLETERITDVVITKIKGE